MHSKAVRRLGELVTPSPAKLTRDEIAKRCNVTKQTVSDWLSGRYKPTLDRMLEIERMTLGAIKVADWVDPPSEEPKEATG